MAATALDDTAAPGDSPQARYRNRELSWLDFNERVLALAGDDRVPLLERAKFLAIFSQNLDEFFQVRVAALKDQVAAGLTDTTPDGLSPVDQLTEIRDRIEVPASSTASPPTWRRPASSCRHGATSTRTTRSSWSRRSRSASSRS